MKSDNKKGKKKTSEGGEIDVRVIPREKERETKKGMNEKRVRGIGGVIKRNEK